MIRVRLWPISNHRANFVAAFILLLLHRGKVVLQSLLSLDTTVSNLADFITVKLGPLGSIVLIEEVDNKYGINEVDKRIAHVAVVFEVNR